MKQIIPIHQKCCAPVFKTSLWASVRAFLFLVLILFSIGFGATQKAFAIQFSAFDSLSGYGTEVNITEGSSGSEKKVIVKSPQNNIFSTFLTLNTQGKGSVIIPPEETLKAGTYSFTVVGKDGFYSDGIRESFEIFPDDPSQTKSIAYAVDTTVKTGVKGMVTVMLMDQYHNPISGHQVSALSNRTEDRITPVSTNRTNSKGEISFWIQSNSSGISTISFHDESSGTTLAASPSVQFYTFFTEDGFQANISDTTSNNTFSKISRFELEFPDTVTADSDAQYLTVRALNSDGNTVKDFVGSIKIQVPTDQNATVPGEEGIYTFLEKDQGEITFSRSVIFPEDGIHKLQVYAYDKEIDEINYNIFGEQTITVEEKRTSGNGNNTEDIPEVIAPENNARFSSGQLSVSGTALKNSDLKVVIDDIPVAEVTVDGNGKFQAVIKNISSGEHSLTVYQKENPSAIAQTIQFTVDTKVSGAEQVMITPTQSLPEEKIEITVIVEDQKDISSITATLNKSSYILDNVGKNTYQKNISAPKTPGTYPVSITITDTLQNTKTVAAETITITENTEAPSPQSLEAVYNSTTKSVDLSWKKSSQDPLLYIIHSGITKTQMNKIKSVSGKSTEVSIPDLSEGKYFFSMSVVDINGTEGEKSEPIQVSVLNPTPTPTPATPTPTATPTPATPTPKPATPTPIPDPQVFVQTQENSIRVSWEKTTNADGYNISYGTSARSYLATESVSGNNTQFTLTDLIPGVQYFIQLEATGNNRTIFSYPEQTETPKVARFHSAPVSAPQPYPSWIPQTGPQFFYFLAAIFFFFSAWYLTRKEER